MGIELKALMTANFDDAEYMHEVSELKRALELWTTLPGFAQRFGENAEEALKEYGVDTSPESVRIMVDPETAARCWQKPELLPRDILRYSEFLSEKLRERDAMRLKYCVPKDERFRAWRERQANRCWEELGDRNNSVVHVPLVFELSDGCSVGCPFCGLASGRLQSVFHYTPENAELWRGVLTASRDIIGEAAGYGTCYYASEGLDDPDYELFVADYYSILGHIPQLTTAVAMRDVERTRAFLNWSRETEGCIHRFSVLSVDIFKRILEAFTPEDLLLVELLPQFAEAPSNGFVKAGRARDADIKASHPLEETTISCCSGFVVNMARRDIRLTTPCPSSNEHPTGELLLARRSFSDAEDFRRQLEKMIAENMTPDPSEERILTLREDISIHTQNGEAFLGGANDCRLPIPQSGAVTPKTIADIIEVMKKNEPVCEDDAALMLMETKGISPAHFFYIVNLLCRNGLCFESYKPKAKN